MWWIWSTFITEAAAAWKCYVTSGQTAVSPPLSFVLVNSHCGCLKSLPLKSHKPLNPPHEPYSHRGKRVRSYVKECLDYFFCWCLCSQINQWHHSRCFPLAVKAQHLQRRHCGQNCKIDWKVQTIGNRFYPLWDSLLNKKKKMSWSLTARQAIAATGTVCSFKGFCVRVWCFCVLPVQPKLGCGSELVSPSCWWSRVIHQCTNYWLDLHEVCYG